MKLATELREAAATLPPDSAARIRDLAEIAARLEDALDEIVGDASEDAATLAALAMRSCHG